MLMQSEREIQRTKILKEGRLDLLAQVIGFQVTPFHQFLIDKLQEDRQRGQAWRLWLAARGFGKSTILTITDCIHQYLLDPNIRIMIGSRTKDQAAGILNGIKGRLKVEHFMDLFGDLQGEKWGEREVTLNTRKIDFPEPTFYAAGADGAVASKHFDMIKADDLMDEKNARTEGERQKVHTFVYKTMVPTLMITRENGKPGEFDAVGTRYHPEDIYNHFMHNDPEFKKGIHVVPSLVNDEGDPDPEGTSTCPEFAPTTKLQNRRISMGPAHYDSQMQQSTKRMQGEIFHGQHFRYYEGDPKELANRLNLKIWSACDLAIGENTKGDKYADVTIGTDPETANIYVLDKYNKHVPYTTQIQRADYIFETWDPLRFGIESNAFQKGRLGAVYRELGTAIGDRCVPVLTHKDKITRAWKLQAMYENGRIFHRRNLDADLEDQLIEFPNGKFDDLFDALELAIMLGIFVGARKRRKSEPGLFGSRGVARKSVTIGR